ncbi:MAG: hydantoinase/oxoprolinase family protein, partial [Rhodospirillaceae bacterium]|nr:hydantoinase/oxoprolinase family protein [Rhodospirillaceae bacterium]
SLCAVDAVIHGTTLVANALIERKGVKTGLITTRGFKDVLEIGREWRYDLFNLDIELPEPIVSRPDRYEITERTGPDGTVITPISLSEIDGIADSLAASGIDSVGVCLLHAYRNSAHETAIRDRLAEISPTLSVSLSSDVSPEMGEYERTSTTVANAYVHPIFKTYVDLLVDGLLELGFRKDLLLVLSDGRTVRQDTATQFPIRLVQSGPAAGAQAASIYGAMSNERDLLCFDMGGTTAKACLIEDGEPERTANFEVARVFRFAEGSGLPLQIPAIDMIEIGAGGGSIARVDRLGLIQVGPDSASSDPGPACYGLGGTEATVTDADLILGYLDPGNFLGGKMTLDKAAAERALQNAVATPLAMSVEQAAWGIHETVTANMAQAAAVHAIEKGLNVTNFTVVPIGGAGPVHACSLARKMGIERMICPVGAGVASAIGMLGSPISFELAQANMSRLDAVDWPQIEAMVQDMVTRGQNLVRHAGVSENEISITISAMMRYVGQGYEVDAPVDLATIQTGNISAIAGSFSDAYLKRFGRTEKMPPEITTWRVVVSGPRPPLLDSIRVNHQQRASALTPKTARPVYFGAEVGFVETPVFDRETLGPGALIDGPAVLEEVESTLIIPPDFSGEVDEGLNVVVSRKDQTS